MFGNWEHLFAYWIFLNFLRLCLIKIRFSYFWLCTIFKRFLGISFVFRSTQSTWFTRNNKKSIQQLNMKLYNKRIQAVASTRRRSRYSMEVDILKSRKDKVISTKNPLVNNLYYIDSQKPFCIAITA